MFGTINVMDTMNIISKNQLKQVIFFCCPYGKYSNNFCITDIILLQFFPSFRPQFQTEIDNFLCKNKVNNNSNLVTECVHGWLVQSRAL